MTSASSAKIVAATWGKKSDAELFRGMVSGFHPVHQQGVLVAYDITWRERAFFEENGLVSPDFVGQTQRVFRELNEDERAFVARCNKIVLDEAKAIVKVLSYSTVT